MVFLKYNFAARQRLAGIRQSVLTGVVASGNLEVLMERTLEGTGCEIEVTTPVRGFDETWSAVLADFVERVSPGGLRISINDGGARPDTVQLRLMQGCVLMEDS